MQIAPRILRAMADSAYPPSFTNRQLDRRDHILNVGLTIFAQLGQAPITFRGMAIALRISTATLRFHYADLEALMAAIIRRHLLEIAKALSAVPHNAHNRQELRRAAYVAATRTAMGGLTEAHLLLVRERHNLPDDERIPIELTRNEIGAMLGGDFPEQVFLFLDAPCLDPQTIEPLIALVTKAQSFPQLPEPTQSWYPIAAMAPRAAQAQAPPQ